MPGKARALLRGPDIPPRGTAWGASTPEPAEVVGRRSGGLEAGES